MLLHVSKSIGLLSIVPIMMLILCSSYLQAQKKPNILILMTDDTGWGDFGYMPGGGAALGHPTPHIDQMAKEGAIFTNWYGQASCTAGRASFITGRIPIRSAFLLWWLPEMKTDLKQKHPPLPNFLKRMAIPLISRVNGIWEINQNFIRSNTGLMK